MDSSTYHTFYPVVALSEAPRPTGVPIFDAANELGFGTLEPTNYQEIVSSYPSRDMSNSTHSNFNGVTEESRMPILNTQYHNTNTTNGYNESSSFSAPYITDSTTGIDIERRSCGTNKIGLFENMYEKGEEEHKDSWVDFIPLFLIGGLTFYITMGILRSTEKGN